MKTSAIITIICLVSSANAGKVDRKRTTTTTHKSVVSEKYDPYLNMADNNNRKLLGESFCTYSPDKTCYATGWPACCDDKKGKDCPKEQPPCEITAPMSMSMSMSHEEGHDDHDDHDHDEAKPDADPDAAPTTLSDKSR